MPMTNREDAALIVVDVQHDFLPGGSLAVPNGDEVIAPINRLAKAFRHVVLTQDWHPAGHISFASTHAGRRPFERIELPYGTQILWPDHCVQGNDGGAIHADLDIPHALLILRKGCNPQVDSYSAFVEADGTSKTGLDGYLTARGIRSVYIAGLATDFCVAWSAIDARKLGFEAWVIEDACRGIDTEGSLAAAWRDMETAGVKRVRVADVV
jgi:nicotinamidase/pyrazinamidase